MNAAILLDHERTPNPGQHVLRALLRIDGDPPEGRRRVPLNVSIVLDRSGSMTGAKLDAARRAASLLLSRLWPEDVVGVVAYDDEARSVVDAAPRSLLSGLGARLASIRPGGCTNLSGGWLLGRHQLEEHRAPERSSRVLLLTDGLANVGMTDPDQLSGLLHEARTAGVTTTTIGFGEDFDEHLLARLADAGGGNTYYIEEPDQAPGVFQAEVGELLGLSAQNLTASVRLEERARLGAVHHSYPREEVEGGLRLHLGDLYASEPKLLLLEVVVEEGAHPERAIDVATVDVSGDVRNADGSVEHRRVTMPIRFTPAGGPVVEPEVRRELLFLRAAAAREAALEDCHRGDVRSGARRLREAADAMRSLGDASDPRVREEAHDLDGMARRLEAEQVGAADLKYMSQRSRDTSRSKASSWARTSRSRRREEEE